VQRKTKVTVIDGTKQTVAPSPQRGLVKLVYQTVKELERATEAQIKKYLPVIAEDATLYMDKKKFESCLYSAVYSGYLITDKGQYRVAPLSYYEARQEIVAENKANFNAGNGRKVKKRKHPKQDQVTYVRPMWHWTLIASVGVITLCVGFLLGLITGLLLHSV
jgi:hypothetical protein